MTSHSPLPVGAIKTRVLILLIVLIVCGVAGTVIFTHFLRAESKPGAATTMPRAQPADLPPGVTALVGQSVESLYTPARASSPTESP